MSSMARRLLPWRSWNWMTSSAAWISVRSRPLVGPVPHSRTMSCSSRLYLLMRCTGFRRYEDRSILSPSSSCFCCGSKRTSHNTVIYFAPLRRTREVRFEMSYFTRPPLLSCHRLYYFYKTCRSSHLEEVAVMLQEIVWTRFVLAVQGVEAEVFFLHRKEMKGMYSQFWGNILKHLQIEKDRDKLQ